jgi:hypothetical protein
MSDTTKPTELELRARLEEAYFWAAAQRSTDPHGFRDSAMFKWGKTRITELRDQIDSIANPAAPESKTPTE